MGISLWLRPQIVCRFSNCSSGLSSTGRVAQFLGVSGKANAAAWVTITGIRLWTVTFLRRLTVMLFRRLCCHSTEVVWVPKVSKWICRNYWRLHIGLYLAIKSSSSALRVGSLPLLLWAKICVAPSCLIQGILWWLSNRSLKLPVCPM